MNRFALVSYLALRRLLPRSKASGASLLPRLAFASIVLGVAASILILSLANGLHESYLSRLAGKDAHIVALAPSRGIPNYEILINQIEKIEGITSAFPYAQTEALLKSSFSTTGIIVKALPSSFDTDDNFGELFSLKEGKWSFGRSRTLMAGEALARSMGLFIGDYVNVLMYDPDLGAVNYRFQVSAFFSAGDSGLDTGMVFIPFSDAQEILGMGTRAPYIGIRVQDYTHPEKYLSSLEKIIPFDLSTWKMSNLNAILALENEKQIIQVLLFIFFCVAFFGILSVMTALVADKREEIALLKVLGMRPMDDALSFLLTGFYLGLSASSLGAVLGLLASYYFNNIIYVIEIVVSFFINQPFTFLNKDVYYLSEFPISISANDVVFSMVLAIFCVWLASLYPAYLSRRFRPAEILRKE
ncbi:MAG: ABC transporter permease [Brevinema sp.]